MLILLCDESVSACLENKNKPSLKHKKSVVKSANTNRNRFERYSFYAADTLCYVLTSDRSFFCQKDKTSLYEAFCGSLLASQSLYDIEDIRKNLFDIKPYYKKYAAVAFADYLKNCRRKNITAAFYDISGEYIRCFSDIFLYVKCIDFYTDSNDDFKGMIDTCFKEYGYRPHIYPYSRKNRADVAADMDSVTENGLFEISVSGENRILPFRLPHYKINGELEKLNLKGVHRDYITAAFLDTEL